MEYIKNVNPNAHLHMFKVVIRTNGETEDANIVNLFEFTLLNIMSNALYKLFLKVQNDEQGYM